MRNVNVIKDINENNIVLINDIIFKGKRQINRNDVKNYLEQYVGGFYEIADTKDIVYIFNDGFMGALERKRSIHERYIRKDSNYFYWHSGERKINLLS